MRPPGGHRERCDNHARERHLDTRHHADRYPRRPRGRGEAGLPGWLDSAPTLTAEQTRLTDLHLVGNYAVSPHWGDGHSTGFYPFVLLRHQCPCPVCAAERASTAGHVGG